MAESGADREADDGAARIDHHIPGRAGSRGDERLMKFVERGVDRRNDESQGSSAPEVVLALAERAIKKCRQNRVLGEMRALANGPLNRRDGRSGNIGSDPAQERNKKA